MLKQVRLADCAGKTIKAAGETYTQNPTLVIVFTDETFCQIEALVYCELPETTDNRVVLPHDTNSDHAAWGVISEKEQIAARAAEDERKRKRIEERDRREFERLRARFGQ